MSQSVRSQSGSRSRKSRHTRPLNIEERVEERLCNEKGAFFRVAHQRRGFTRRFLDGTQQIAPTRVSSTCVFRRVGATDWNLEVKQFIDSNPNPSSPTGRYSAAEAAYLLKQQAGGARSPRSTRSARSPRASTLGQNGSGSRSGSRSPRSRLGGLGLGAGSAPADLGAGTGAGSDLGLGGLFGGRNGSGSYGAGSSRRRSNGGSSYYASGRRGSNGYSGF